MSCNAEIIADLLSVQEKYDAGDIVDRNVGMAWMMIGNDAK